MTSIRLAIVACALFIAAAAHYLGAVAYDYTVAGAAWVTRTMDSYSERIHAAREARRLSA